MIDPSVIPATFGGLDLLLLVALAVLVAWVYRRTIIREVNLHVPDTERRRRQMLILNGLQTVEREKQRRIRGEESEGL